MIPELKPIISSGFIPKPSFIEKYDPGAQDLAKARIQEIFSNDLLINAGGLLQYLNPFSKWIDCSAQEAIDQTLLNIDNAYKQLRKLLLEDGLYAVASLPSGV